MMNLEQKYQEGDTESYSKTIVMSLVQDVLCLAKKRLKKKINEITILDVGSGHGEYSKEFAKYVKKVVGVEPYFKAYSFARKNNKAKNVRFYNSLVEDCKIREKFDIVVSLTTLEHMPNAEKSLDRIYKLMGRNSLLYLTAPNKLWPYDNHYRLPFITWLPLPMADIYMRIMRRGSSYKDCSYSRTYFGVKSLFKRFNWRFEFLLPNPKSAYIGCRRTPSLFPYELVKNLGIKLIERFPVFWIISKGFIVVAEKN